MTIKILTRNVLILFRLNRYTLNNTNENAIHGFADLVSVRAHVQRINPGIT